MGREVDGVRAINVLSLGAGIQSTALYLMYARGEMPVKLDVAIFADTQEEPRAVYEHLAWLKSLNGPPIITGTAGKLGDDLVLGRNSTGGRFASIPAFTTKDGGSTVGITRRQCSKEYKTEVIGKVLRREVLGLKPGQHVPRGVQVNQNIGISLDEAGRAVRMERNVPPPKYIKRVFPLIDRFETRSNAKAYLADKVPHETPRSEGFARAVEVDHGLRQEGSVANRDMDQTMYLHRSCKPLELVQFNPQPPTSRAVQLPMNFAGECEGMCGL